MTTQTRMTLTITVKATTYDEVMQKALKLANQLGIEDPTFMEAVPLVKEFGEALPKLWEVEIDHRDIMTLAQEGLEIEPRPKKARKSWISHVREEEEDET